MFNRGRHIVNSTSAVVRKVYVKLSSVRINHCSAEHWSAVHEYAPMRYVIDQV